MKFEHVCHAVQWGITTILGNAGIQDQRVSHVIVAGLTAEPLRSLYESLIGQTQELTDIEKRMLKDALNRFQKLTQERNDIVHGMWTVGWGNEETKDFSIVEGHKRHKDKSGEVFKQFSRSPEDFGKLSLEAESLTAVFLGIMGCISFGDRIDKCLVMSPDGRVSMGPAKYPVRHQRE